MTDYNQKAKKIIRDNIYMVIATSSKESKPWISPVFFAYDKKYNLFWVSNKESLHSKLIQQNPEVAIVIFDSSVPEGKGAGVYFEAKAMELADDKEIKTAMEVLSKRVTVDDFKVKNVKEVTGEGVWRIYKATPSKISVLTEGKFIKGQYVDERTEINI